AIAASGSPLSGLKPMGLCRPEPSSSATTVTTAASTVSCSRASPPAWEVPIRTRGCAALLGGAAPDASRAAGCGPGAVVRPRADQQGSAGQLAQEGAAEHRTDTGVFRVVQELLGRRVAAGFWIVAEQRRGEPERQGDLERKGAADVAQDPRRGGLGNCR